MPLFLCCWAFVPGVRILDITIDNTPGDFLITQLHTLQMPRTCYRPSVVNNWRYRNNLHTFQQNIEVFHFLTSIINMIELEFSALQRLTRGDSFVEIRAGAINLFIEQKRCMFTCARQFPCRTIGRNAEVMSKAAKFYAPLAILNVGTESPRII